MLTFPALSPSDPASHCHFTEVHLWETHFGQAREILHEKWIRTGTNWRSHKRPFVIKFYSLRSVMKFVSRSPKPPFFFCERWSIAIGIPSRHLEELPKTKKDKWTSAENAVRTTPAAVAPHQADPPPPSTNPLLMM